MNKKFFIRTLAAVMIMAMVLPIAVGCRDNSNELFVPPDFVFVPEFITLPDEISDMGRSGLIYLDGKIIFVTSKSKCRSKFD